MASLTKQVRLQFESRTCRVEVLVGVGPLTVAVDSIHKDAPGARPIEVPSWYATLVQSAKIIAVERWLRTKSVAARTAWSKT